MKKVLMFFFVANILVGNFSLSYSASSKTKLSKEYNDVSIDNYTQFYTAVNNAIVKKQTMISLLINKYDKNTYSIKDAVKQCINKNKSIKYIVSELQYNTSIIGARADIKCNLTYQNSDSVSNNNQELTNNIVLIIKKNASGAVIKLNGNVNNYVISDAINNARKQLPNFMFDITNMSTMRTELFDGQIFKFSVVYKTATNNDNSQAIVSSTNNKAIVSTNSYEIKNLDDVESYIKQSLKSGTSEIKFNLKKAGSISFEDFHKKVAAIIENNCEYRYFNKWNTGYSSDGYTSEFTVSYQLNFTTAQIRNMEMQIDNRIKSIITSQIKPVDTDFEKEKKLHDYLVNNARYDVENFNANTILAEDYSAYGVLVKGIGVCEGYSYAFKRLMNAAGISCMVVTGEVFGNSEGPHAWNIVKLRNHYYHVDATFDDPIISGSKDSRLSHDYFNITDSAISKDHIWDKSKYPTCDIEMKQ